MEALGTCWSRSTQKLDEGAEKYLKKSDTAEFKRLTPRKRKPWQHVDPTYHPRCSTYMPKPEDDFSGLVGRLQNAEDNDQGGKMTQQLTFYMPKRTRGPRKRRVYGSIHEELMNSDFSASPWTLQSCSIRRKMETDAREDENQHRLRGRKNLWCEEESYQRPWNEGSGGLSLHNEMSGGLSLCNDLSEGIVGHDDASAMIHNERSGGLSLYNDSFEGIGGQDDASVKEFLCRDEPSLTLANVTRINTSKPAAELDLYPRLRDLLFDGQVDQFEDVTRREHLLGFDNDASGMVEFTRTPPSLRRSFSVGSPKVRRCLYGLDLKWSYTNDFWFHSERQTVSNLEMKSACMDREEIWTPKQGALTIDFPGHGFYRDSQEEFEGECHQNDLIYLKNMHNLQAYTSCLSPPSKERDVNDFLPTSSTHAVNGNFGLDKGGKTPQRQLLKQTTVEDSGERPRSKEVDAFSFLPTPSTDVLNKNPSTHVANKVAVSDKNPSTHVAYKDAVSDKGCKEKPLKQSTAKESSEGPPTTRLRQTLSGPPFYRPPLKHAASDGLSTLDRFRECKSRCEFRKDFEENFQEGKQLGKSLEDRHQISTAAASGCKLASEKRGLQEAAKSRFEDIQNISPSKRIGGDGIKSKWRDTVCDDISTKDGLADTALQLYKDWKNPCIRSVEPNILDLSSGVLGPSNKHLFPDSISKEGLQKAEVLRQMDKKFIATVAEQTLVVIDQHAADERVRLEQLRKEVLEEKQHLSTLLDYPQELSISLGEQQLLYTYKAQVEEWGWRFKILAEQKISNGRRLGHVHHGNTAALLAGVPNILGESLTNVKYLSEYLRQLASTDGTSTPPPAVLRVLASKACRGAIMFGDYLLRSECQQLVESLKKTALSFQCAHGRPTLVPIVNLEALHTRLGKQHCRKRLADNTDGMVGTAGRNAWHGLQWHRATVKRAMERLKQAEEMM